MLFYFNQFVDNSITYSIDMLRINIIVNPDIISFLKKEILTSSYGFDVKYYHSTGSYKYSHLFNFYDIFNECSFSLGFGIGSDKFKGFFEFNPNKFMNNQNFILLIKFIFNHINYFEFVRYDLAIDIPINRSLIYLKNNYSTSKIYQYIKGSDSSITEYLGKRNNHGYIKLYDKGKESKLDQDLTRLEITVDYGKEFNIPDILYYKLKEYDFSNLPGTDRTLLLLCCNYLNDFNMNFLNTNILSNLDSRKRTSIRSILENTVLMKYNLSLEASYSCINNFFSSFNKIVN